jgi:hypothetical protein
LTASRDNWLRFVLRASFADPPITPGFTRIGADGGCGGRANQAWLFSHELDVDLVTKAARLTMCKPALVDAMAMVRPTDAASCHSSDEEDSKVTSLMPAALRSVPSFAWNAPIIAAGRQ